MRICSCAKCILWKAKLLRSFNQLAKMLDGRGKKAKHNNLLLTANIRRCAHSCSARFSRVLNRTSFVANNCLLTLWALCSAVRDVFTAHKSSGRRRAKAYLVLATEWSINEVSQERTIRTRVWRPSLPTVLGRLTLCAGLF